MNKNIVYFGITDLDCYPTCKYGNCCKEFIENDTLCIPCKKPDVEDIDNIHVDCFVKDFKIIKTIQGYKIVVTGIIKYKVMYTADTCEQSVHTAHWERCFCQFLLLPKSLNVNNVCISDVFIGIEDIILKSNGSRVIDLCLLLILIPIFKVPSPISQNTLDDCYYNKNKCDTPNSCFEPKCSNNIPNKKPNDKKITCTKKFF
ncbi:hypothetical protein TPELB_08920 [Terrisporobacter petrolearius]|uniref:SipL SPOCS domain-containing protein n=1 Tax=Terrisporobacter petrolearius TaxID=1460447 RepID=A0ABZ3F9V7_9FIRM